MSKRGIVFRIHINLKTANGKSELVYLSLFNDGITLEVLNKPVWEYSCIEICYESRQNQ